MNTTRHFLHKSWLIIGLILIAIGLVACAPASGDAVDNANGGQLYVDEVDVLLMESFPLQARAVVRGNLADGCTALSNATATRNDNTFTIVLEATRDPEMMCTQALVPFEESITLDILGLPAGTYTVMAGEQSATFQLGVDNE